MGDRAARYRELWEDEIAGAALYRVLAEHADAAKGPILLQLAEAEERHAAHWAELYAGADGGELPATVRLPLRVKVLSWLARRFGSDAVLPMVLRLEAADAAKYDAEAEAPSSMATQERLHGRVVAALGGTSTPGERIARAEGRHRAGVGGALRAAVFGANDGLVSNLSLVMGVAGGTGNSSFVLLAGVAGLLAGAFSMAAGEWVSVRSQRELYEREIEVEREELAAFPEEEEDELALIYRAKGIEPEAAKKLAERIMLRPAVALDTMVREELGLSPEDLGSPWVAAGSSFVSFALGAIVPVLAFIFGSGSAALIAAALSSAAALFVVGALISILTGRAAALTGLRMVVIGAVAAAATYGIGTAIGVGVS